MNVNARTADETAPAPGEVVFRIRLDDTAHPIVTDAHKPAIRDAIENAVNRIGEEADLG